MKHVLLIIALFFSFSVFAINNVAPKDLQQVISTGDIDFIIIDVRTESEFNENHIDGALLFPLQDLAAQVDYIVENFSDKKIYLICRSGRRSSIAYGILSKFNLNLANVVGGMLAWENLPH